MKNLVFVAIMLMGMPAMASNLVIKFDHCVKVITVKGKYKARSVAIVGVYVPSAKKVRFMYHHVKNTWDHHRFLIDRLFGHRNQLGTYLACHGLKLQCKIINKVHCHEDRI